MLLLPEKVAGPGQGPAAAGRTTFSPSLVYVVAQMHSICGPAVIIP